MRSLGDYLKNEGAINERYYVRKQYDQFCTSEGKLGEHGKKCI